MSKWKQLAIERKQSKWKQLAIEKTLAQQKAQPSEPPEPGFLGTLQSEGVPQGLKEGVSNIPGSAVEYGKSIVYPYVHPLKTAKSMIDLAMGTIEKIPGGQYITPGPEYDVAGKENNRTQAVDATVEYFKERYGSLEGAKDALKKDPVGMIADLASLLVGGGGVLRSITKESSKLSRVGTKIAKLGGYAEPLNVLTMPLRGAKRLIPEKLSSRLYEGAAKFSTTLTTEQRNLITKTALDKQIMPTMNGLRKLSNQIEDLNIKIANVIDEAATTGKVIPIKRLLKGFHELKQNSRFSGKPLDAQRAVNSIRKQLIEANTLTIDPITKKRVLRKLDAAEAQKLKQSIYRELEGYYSSVTNNPVSVKAQKTIARNAKEVIEELVPEIKQLNKQDGDLLALRKQIDRVAPRIANRDLLSLGTTAKAAGGGVVFGKVGLATGLALGMLDSQPVIKARLALIIHKMRERGIKVRMTPAVARLMSYETGEISQQIAENEK